MYDYNKSGQNYLNCCFWGQEQIFITRKVPWPKNVSLFNLTSNQLNLISIIYIALCLHKQYIQTTVSNIWGAENYLYIGQVCIDLIQIYPLIYIYIVYMVDRPFNWSSILNKWSYNNYSNYSTFHITFTNITSLRIQYGTVIL